MTNIKSSMKNLLAEGLYLIMLQKSFDKITIKQICDKTGVIRGTFYNHFIDKYEALEYLVYYLLIEDKMKYLESKKYNDLMHSTIQSIYEHKDFFYKAFQIVGQNNFDSILENLYKKIFIQVIDENKLKTKNLLVSKEFLSTYYANSFIFIIKNWVNHGCTTSQEEVCYTLSFLLTKSFYEVM